MKLSDYIVEFLIEKEISDVFGYPGGMVTHLMSSFDKYRNKIVAHTNYHEQASAFAACGYAQVAHKPGVAYATSGPGATNLVTGIANAYFDGIPCVFITGQVNTYESKGELGVRQKGFQETDIISIVNSITKYAVKVDKAEDIKYELEKAWHISLEGRPGPVLIDIPMNIQRAEVEPDTLRGYDVKDFTMPSFEEAKEIILKELNNAKKPVILAGNGIKTSGMTKDFRKLVALLGVPVVTSMIGKDAIEESSMNNYGFVGAYGNRYANFILSNSDLIITMGSRIDCRQTGSDLKLFAEQARIIRIDVDPGEVTNKIKENEICIIGDLRHIIPALNTEQFNLKSHYTDWLKICNEIKIKLKDRDLECANAIIKEFSQLVPNDTIITTDVGQNQIWVAQSFEMKDKQNMLFSGGHGAMGYSLPAAIGAYYGSRKKVICFNGDGGFQMNMQELQFIVREKLPIKIVLLNNASLGMIRHFQEMYFDSNFVQTKKESGYTTPNFKNLIESYGIKYTAINQKEDISLCQEIIADDEPHFIEVNLSDTTYVFPKLAMGRPIHDQEPLLEREEFDELMEFFRGQ